MAIDSNLITGPLATADWFSDGAASLKGLAGITGNASVTANEFDGTHGVRALVVTGSGGATTVYSLDGGVVGNATGTGAAGGSVNMYGAQVLSQNPKHIGNLRTSRWGFAARLALLNTNVDAGQTIIGAGLTDGGSTYRLNMGLNAAASATHFSMSDTGSTVLVSTTAIDTAFHDFMAWNDGTTVNFRVDTGSIVSVAATTLSTIAAEWGVIVTTGTGLSVSGYKIDKLMIITQAAA